MPRTLPPSACAGVEAITWPSISGTACLTPGDACQPLGDLGVAGEVVAADLVDDDVAVEAQDLVEQLLAEAVHDGHHR